MPVITLKYFPGWGRAGSIRVALKAAKLEFQDVRLPYAEFAKARETRPADFPLGQMPVIEIDGVAYTQSTAILRWAGKQASNSAVWCYTCCPMDVFPLAGLTPLPVLWYLTLLQGGLYPTDLLAALKVDEIITGLDDMSAPQNSDPAVKKTLREEWSKT